MTELVESEIEKELISTKGTIVHDAWPNNGTHYLGVFASYMRTVSVKRDGTERQLEELALPMLSVGILPKVSGEIEEEDDGSMPLTALDNNEEAVQFNAETHIQQLYEVFNIFITDFREWCLCSIADNAKVNKRIARSPGIPHVGCLIHKLNVEVNGMVRADPVLTSTISFSCTIRGSCYLEGQQQLLGF